MPSSLEEAAMDWTAAIEKNREALKRVLAMLIAMAGLGDGKATLPRHLHRAMLRLLRPAESAARRLVIAAARGMVVELPPPRKFKPKPMVMEPLLRSFGIAIVMSPADLAPAAAAKRAAAIRGARPRTSSLPLLDTLRRPFRNRRRYVPAHAAPRILFPGITEPFSLPPPPSPDDPINAARLSLRLAALAAVLDDLPGHARRFARWKARGADAAGAQKLETRAAALAEKKPGRIRRIWPLRPGRPPGGRLSRYDPSATHPRKIREVDEILAHAHALAVYALEAPDTS
jgi:hypothetical protein